MLVRKGMHVRHFCDDGRGGGYVYGVAVTNGSKRPRIRWENGNEQVVPIHALEIVTGDLPSDVLHRLRKHRLGCYCDDCTVARGKEHAEADARCGRERTCQCGACVRAREININRAFTKLEDTERKLANIKAIKAL